MRNPFLLLKAKHLLFLACALALLSLVLLLLSVFVWPWEKLTGYDFVNPPAKEVYEVDSRKYYLARQAWPEGPGSFVITSSSDATMPVGASWPARGTHETDSEFPVARGLYPGYGGRGTLPEKYERVKIKCELNIPQIQITQQARIKGHFSFKGEEASKPFPDSRTYWFVDAQIDTEDINLLMFRNAEERTAADRERDIGETCFFLAIMGFGGSLFCLLFWSVDWVETHPQSWLGKLNKRLS